MQNAALLLGLTRQEVESHYSAVRPYDEVTRIPFDDDRSYSGIDDAGVDLVFKSNDRVSTVFIYADSPLLQALGICFVLNRQQIRSLLGNPELSGEDFVSDFLGPKGGWDRFALLGYRVHIQYVYENDNIEMVTFMTNEVATRVSDT